MQEIPPFSHIPPASLINLESATQRFGPQKIELLIELSQTGDLLADAVIQELETLGPEASHNLKLGIVHGLHILQNPSPALQTFLSTTELLPTWVDSERLNRGSAAYLSIGDTWILLSLGPGSLTHTYSSPSIARILVQTGNLTKMAYQRLIETGIWNVKSVLPGGLTRGAEGYIHNLQVRLLHARVRRTLLKRGWDSQAADSPINQIEMVRTWLDFTYVPFSALQKFGITFTSDELADLYHFWQYIAYLLGIDERIYREIIDQQHAQDLLALIDSTSEGANEDSRQLTQAMLKAVAKLLQLTVKLSDSLAFDLVSAITRHLHGNALADQLGVKKTWLSTIMPVLTLTNRIQRLWDRRNPAARQRAITRTILAFQQATANASQTTYQHNTDNPTQQDLPQTTVPSTIS
jgi:ER-bound oxygenase mpaB/B'/Rubber oxygenase, catalytic domain